MCSLVKATKPFGWKARPNLDFGEEALNLTIRHDLMLQIEAYIKKNNYTTRKAGEVLGISSSRVSDLLNGRIDKFSIDYLINLLPKAGFSITIDITPKKTSV